MARKNDKSFYASLVGGYKLYLNPDNCKWVVVGCETSSSNERVRSKLLACEKIESHVSDWSCGKISGVSVLPTNKCNLKCKHCFYSSSPLSRLEWDSEISKKALELIKALKVRHVTIGGGEPFLWPGIRSFLNQLSKLNIKTTILTNGLLLNDKFLKLLHDKKIMVQVSVDSSCAELYQFIRGGDFKQLLKNINLLNEYKIPIDLSYTINNHNISNIVDYMIFSKRINFCSLHFPLLEEFGRSKEHHLFLPSNIGHVLEFLAYVSIQEKIPITFVRTILKCWINNKIKLHCSAADTQLSIASDGNVYPCSELINNRFVIHNLAQNKLDLSDLYKKIKVNRKINGFGSNVADKVCPDCHIKYFCAGLCRAKVLNLDSQLMFYNSKDTDLKCKTMKNIAEKILWLFLNRQGFVTLKKEDILSKEALKLVKEYEVKSNVAS